jgi:serine/threonine-protein kinase
MRFCPQCRQGFRSEANYCPEDGSRLVVEDPFVGTVLLGQIEVLELCGHGSMGTVYRAWQRQMDRQVAVKILHRDLIRDEQVVRRFRREAQAAARLSHPNIITVYLVGDTPDGLPFMVMEFVEGRSLDAICADEAPLDVGRALQITRQIASALAEAHEQGIVHRDLKPANILLADKRGMPDFVKVLDFGIAKLLRSADQSQITQTGTIFGTPYYLSPEQASGDDVDHRSDLYSLGVMLFRMVTGQLPFAEAAAMDVLVQQIKTPPPRPTALQPGLPPAVEQLILRLLAKTADQRFQSAEILSTAIDALAEDLYGPSWSPPSREPSIPRLVVGKDLPDAGPDAGGATPPPAGDAAAPPVAAGPVALPPTATTLRAPPATPSPGGSTRAMRRQVMRRRTLLHLLFGLLSIAVGAGLGALLRHLQPPARAAAAVSATPPTSPDAAPDAARSEVAATAGRLARDMGRDDLGPGPRARRQRRSRGRVSRRPRSRRRRPARPPSSPDAAPAAIETPPTPPKPPPRPPPIPPLGPDPEVEGSDHDPSTKEEIYDLLE